MKILPCLYLEPCNFAAKNLHGRCNISFSNCHEIICIGFELLLKEELVLLLYQ